MEPHEEIYYCPKKEKKNKICIFTIIAIILSGLFFTIGLIVGALVSATILAALPAIIVLAVVLALFLLFAVILKLCDCKEKKCYKKCCKFE